MKSKLIIIILIFFTQLTFAQNNNPNYNEALAKDYGGDDYGMKLYVMAILKTPKDSTKLKAMSQDLMRGHLDNINRLVEEGKLIVAGPFMQNSEDFRGLFIFDVSTIDEAKALVATDPAVEAGVFDMIYVPWYGSAALKGYLDDSDKIWKLSP